MMRRAAPAPVPVAGLLTAGLLAVGLGAPALLAPELDAAPRRVSAQVDTVFARYDHADSPGCALAVMRDGRIVYERGYGMADLEHGVPIGPTTIFDIASTSKQFTAASIVLLEQRGKLALDDDIRKYVPEIPATHRPITLRHLLHHTSGLRDYLDVMTLAGVPNEDVTTDDDALQILARQRHTIFPAGDEHLYCNSGFFLMSVVVKRVTGQPLREFARANIFEPLGMGATRFHDDHTRIEPGRATGYEPLDGGGFKIDMSNFEQTGDGSVFTNVEDLQRWDENFYEPKVGGPAMLAALQTRGVLTDGTTIDYALGLHLDTYRGLSRVRHGGSWVGYRSELVRFPEQHFSVACLCNLGTAEPGDLAMQVADIYLADRFTAPAEAAAVPAAAQAASGASGDDPDAKGYAGLYRDPATEGIVSVSSQGGRLTLKRDGEEIELLSLGGGRFRGAGDDRDTAVSFETGGGKGSRRLIYESGRRPPIRYEAVRPLSLTAAQLGAYAGTYWSDEIRAPYTLAVENGSLVLVARNLPKEPLVPVGRDRFATSWLTFRFERDASGKLGGFLLGAGRVRDFKFDRSGPSHGVPSRRGGAS